MKRLLACLVLFSACADSTSSNPVDAAVKGTLAVDIRGSADVTLVPRGPHDLDVTVALADGYGLVAPGTPLSAKGRLETFPEASAWQLYTARFSSPPIPSGPCGDKPVSLALALSRRDGNARVAGALTAYCGDATYAGVPARVLRLTGEAK
jgi:hypothetical protein